MNEVERKLAQIKQDARYGKVLWAVALTAIPAVALCLIFRSHYVEIVVGVMLAYILVRYRKQLSRWVRVLRRRRKQPMRLPDEAKTDDTSAPNETTVQLAVAAKLTSPVVTGAKYPHLMPELMMLPEQQRTLSKFARRRLEKRLISFDADSFICELRLPRSEFWVNFDAGTNPHRLIYGALASAFAGLCMLGFAIFPVIDGTPDWLRWSLAGLSVICLLLFWIKYERVAYDRVLLLEREVVFIDEPPLFSGGRSLPYNLREIDKVSITTVRDLYGGVDLRHTLKVRLLSSFANMVGLGWISADTQVQHDAQLNWFGPYRKCPVIFAVLDKQIKWAKLDYVRTVQRVEEDVKDARRETRKHMP